jgi:glycosyltransferase involved in cell wall biosynthesis
MGACQRETEAAVAESAETRHKGNGTNDIRLAVVISHPIQYFTPWFRELAKVPGINLRVFYCCDWGIQSYRDDQFQLEVKWDVPLLEGYDHEFLPIPRRPKSLSFRDLDNASVGGMLDRYAPEVVVVFGYYSRTIWRVVHWARRRKTPVLLCSDSNPAKPRGRLRKAVKTAIVRYFYSRLDGAFCASKNNREYHRLYGMPEERLFPGALPIDKSYFVGSVEDVKEARGRVRERHQIPRDAFVLNLCAKYVSWKAPLDLVAAVGEARKKGVPAWALLVGEGPERGNIEEFCRREEIKAVTLTGFVNQSKIGEYYVASDVVALTSRFDAYGLAVPEGMCFGLPSIVSDQVGCAGPDDAARDGVNAIVYPVGDRAALSEAIERLYRDRALYEKMSRAASLISEELDVTHVAGQLASAVIAVNRMGKR